MDTSSGRVVTHTRNVEGPAELSRCTRVSSPSNLSQFDNFGGELPLFTVEFELLLKNEDPSQPAVARDSPSAVQQL